MPSDHVITPTLAIPTDIVEIIGDLGRFTRKDSNGGRKLTADEIRELVADVARLGEHVAVFAAHLSGA